ncbi:outer membrane protein assembly factor BamB [Oxalicibacterium faecigallinarum]|uniref:Outer membrane protein assembly factor BamB n=1 Tax=Oxalicibacterium faecigallinarum TaxID=573741 RepID=A0A8J3ASN4_9BURK|nr:outer membrane protein assembly factor BamB [Oxalicibacterium faecigallinarum]GGI16172.1 outer membrane protein assembly factor BamB [Oxalicibacterium faecigallinarum]
MRFTSLLCCAGVIVALTGCSSLNPFAKKPNPKTQPAPLVELKSDARVRTVWSASIGKADKYVFTPALVDGNVYVASENGRISKLDLATGRSLWRIDTDTGLTAGVGSDGRTVVVVGEKGVILAYDSEGKQRWKAQATSEVLSAPAIGLGVVLIRSMDNRVTAYDADTGDRKWTVQRTAPPLSLRTAPGITISDGTAYVGFAGGRMLALMLTNGAPRWEVAVGDPRGVTELERIADISGTPVVSGRDVCAVAYQGRVACFDTASGSARWAAGLSSDGGVAVDERNVYVADEKGGVNAFSRMGGTSVWRNAQMTNRRLSTPVSFNDAVATGDFEGYIHFLSKEDGVLIGRIKTGGGAIIARPQMADGFAIFQTQSGSVVAVAAE